MSRLPLAQVTQPLARSAGRYAVEFARSVLFGVLLSALLAVVFAYSTPNAAMTHLMLLALLCAVVFPVLYALVAHQRGLSRALTSMARSHGGFLFDQTLGRFIETVESRRSGAFSALLASPESLARGFRQFLMERPKMPKIIRRIAVRYVDKLALLLSDHELLQEVRTDGEFNPAAFKHMAVTRLQDQFAPSWSAFAVVGVLQVLSLAALSWAAR